MAKRGERGKAYFMISAVSQKYDIHPQTLRLYEREGLLKPSRTEGNTRLYSEEDLEQLETILTLTRDLGVNLAGVEIILNLRRKIELMQTEVNEFMGYVKREMARGIDDWEQRLGTALVKSAPTDLVRHAPPAANPQTSTRTSRSERPTPKPRPTPKRSALTRRDDAHIRRRHWQRRNLRLPSALNDLEVTGRQRPEGRVQDVVAPARIERAADEHVGAIVGDDQAVEMSIVTVDDDHMAIAERTSIDIAGLAAFDRVRQRDSFVGNRIERKTLIRCVVDTVAFVGVVELHVLLG